MAVEMKTLLTIGQQNYFLRVLFTVRDDLKTSVCYHCEGENGALLLATVEALWFEGRRQELTSEAFQIVDEELYRLGWSWVHICIHCYDECMGRIKQKETLR